MAVKTSHVNIEERKNLDLRVGDRVRVWQKIMEKGKTRLQPFEGLVLARKHGSQAGATFTVRRVSQGIGVERIFPLYSPNIDRIEVLRRSKVRRAKLYYIREKVTRQARRKLRKSYDMSISTRSEAEQKQEAEQADQQAESISQEEEQLSGETFESEATASTSKEDTTQSEAAEDETIEKNSGDSTQEEVEQNEEQLQQSDSNTQADEEQKY